MIRSKMHYKVGLVVFFSLLFTGCVKEVQASNQPYRTGYHFQPHKNWMNDPTGPMVYKGIYHLFYQWNPKAAEWGNIVWGHSTSADLINWVPHEPAIYPSQPSDINGCWSGSATILPAGQPVILYTGIDPNQKQVQNLAMPKNLSDPYLTKWYKSPRNPLISPDQCNKINSSSFRDPTTAWLGPDRKWRLVIGSRFNGRGLAILYTSYDFLNWVKSPNPLHFTDGNGMWECPDFFPVSKTDSIGVDTSIVGSNVKHVLKVSLDDTKLEYYTVGTYDHVKDIYVPDEGSVESDSGLRFDYGKFYASKTFFDRFKRRRILWGWVNESSSHQDDAQKGWSGLQAIPRKIWLDKRGKQLIQWPVREINLLRSQQVNLFNKVLEGGSVLQIHGVTAVQADVKVSFEVKDLEKAEVMKPGWTNPRLLCGQKDASVKGGLGPFGLLVLASNGLEEYTAVYFRIFKSQFEDRKYVVLMCSDQSRSSLNELNDRTTYGAFVDIDPLHEKLSLRTLIDHSIVESFGGKGKACITARVYPTLAIEERAYLYAFNNGTQSLNLGKLSAWSLKTASINQEK